MKCVELNATGNFDHWEASKLQELNNHVIDDRLGQKLLFENTALKIWEVILLPGERLPFRKISSDFKFTSLTKSLAISRSETGRILLVHMAKGDSMSLTHDGQASVYDLENIGDTTILLHAKEFKPLVKGSTGLKSESSI